MCITCIYNCKVILLYFIYNIEKIINAFAEGTGVALFFCNLTLVF